MIDTKEGIMKAFHGDSVVKEKYLKRVRAHQAADNLIRGEGWNGFKGCAVGCTLENYDHSQYPIELGIPEWLARVEDTLFEGMTFEKSQSWPEVFLAAINVGADLEKVKTPFLIFILEQNLTYLDSLEYDKEQNPDVVKAVAGSRACVVEMIRCHREGDESAARSAAWSAESAAWSAESAAWSAWSAWSAESAARSAASAAWSAAWSAASAARSAASAARSAARSAEFDTYADKLVELLKAQS